MDDAKGAYYMVICLTFLSILKTFGGVFLFSELLSLPNGIMVPEPSCSRFDSLGLADQKGSKEVCVCVLVWL